MFFVGGVIFYVRDFGVYEGGEIRIRVMVQYLIIYIFVVVLWGYWVRVVILGYCLVYLSDMDNKIYLDRKVM